MELKNHYIPIAFGYCRAIVAILKRLLFFGEQIGKYVKIRSERKLFPSRSDFCSVTTELLLLTFHTAPPR